MELPKHPRISNAEQQAPPEGAQQPQPQKPPVSQVPLNFSEPRTESTPPKPNPFNMSPEDFRKYLEFFDSHGRVDHIAIMNDLPVRAAGALKAVVDDNGWLPSLIVWLGGGKREAWDSAKDSIIAFVRVCDDVQKGMRAIYVLPDVKNWLNNGINWCCQTAWCMVFPEAKTLTEEQKKILAVIEPIFKEWCEKFATPWWKEKRKRYSSLEAMLKEKEQYKLAGESIEWLKENMSDRLPQGVDVKELAASFVLKFADVTADLERDILSLMSKIERDRVAVPDEFKASVRQVTSTRVRDR